MKVVIVGGGFGGVRAALKLANRADFQVKLISERSYFEYHAAIYRAATGRSPLEVAIPLNELFASAKNIEVVKDKIVRLDAKAKRVIGSSGSRYPYQTLVLALGNVTQYFGIAGLKEYSFGIKSLQEALRLKRHLHEDITDETGICHYAVVGAGPSGVELAAELSHYLKRVRRRHRLHNKKFRVDLIEAAPRVLPMMPEAVARRVARRLKLLGIKIITSTPVKAETVEGLTLPTGEIKTHTVIWTAGVTNNPFFKKYGSVFKFGRAGRVIVDEHLKAAEDIYVIGDSADTTFSGLAAPALDQANLVAANLKRLARGKTLKPYVPAKPMSAVPVGRRWSVAIWDSRMLYGLAGWLIRRWLDLRVYLGLLPPSKALRVWRYGHRTGEECTICA